MRFSVSEGYKLLSILLRYPMDVSKVRQAARRLYELVTNTEDLKIAELKGELEDFIQFLESSHLWAIQEEYVKAFDLFPLCPPYLSHHIYGESYRKGEYMVRLKEIYREHGFEMPENLKNELPDHIAVITGFLGTLEQKDRRDFIGFIINGLKKMADAVRNKDTPYRFPILLTYTLVLLEGDAERRRGRSGEKDGGRGEEEKEEGINLEVFGEFENVENAGSVADIADIDGESRREVIKCWMC